MNISRLILPLTSWAPISLEILAYAYFVFIFHTKIKKMSHVSFSFVFLQPTLCIFQERHSHLWQIRFIQKKNCVKIIK